MGKIDSIKQALWNPQTRTCLGRTGDSWLKIIAFYICLYSCLAAIWSLYYGIFHLTISDKYPKWTLNESIIGTNPGLGVRPQNPRDRIDSALIKYRMGSNGDFQHWVGNLNSYLEEMRQAGQLHLEATTKAESEPKKWPSEEEKKLEGTGDNQKEGGGKSGKIRVNCNENKTDDEARESVCPFDSSAMPAECQAAQNYSFPEGRPCILIKLNRIYGWRPQPYEFKPADYPEEVPFNLNHIQITCEGQHDPDKEHLGKVKYYPSEGIETKYYPFLNQPGYQSPYVMVHFTNPKPNTLIYVECKAWAKNIEHDRYNRKGLTTFELFIESDNSTSKSD